MSLVAVVTGGAGGIGAAIVRRLEADGNTVAVLDRVGGIACDLQSTDDVARAAEEVLARHGTCDLLVHAAAAFDRVTLADFDLETWRHVQTVNVESLLLLAQAFVPGMRAKGFGRIISIGSNTFWSPPGPDRLAYVASKGAIIGVTRSLATELGPYGIGVMGVAPGLTRTPGSRTVPEEEFAAVEARQALARPLTPDDVAETVAFLTGRGAQALTGQTLITDGGSVMN